MSRYEVDSDRVATASAKVQTTAAEIQSEVGGMMAHLTELQGCWTGSASAMFADLMTQWRSTQQQVETALDQIRQALGTAAQNYADAESAAMRMFAG